MQGGIIMVYNSKAVIVWIDDHFLTPTFKEDSSKNAWHKLFGKINSRLYRLLDIKIKFIRTKKEADAFLEQKNLFSSNTYYYFIIDRKLPYDYGHDAVDSTSEEIVCDLLEYKKHFNCFDFAILSSGSPDSYAIKNLDYYLKPQNKEFTLPNELRHKILLNIKNNIGFIDQSREYEEKRITNYGTVDQLPLGDHMLYPFIDKFRSFVELQEIVKNDFNTLIVLASRSTSDKFIQQSLLIALYDSLEDYDGINYYKDTDYQSLKGEGYYDNIVEITDKIPVIRLDEWHLDSYDAIFKLLKYRLSVLVIDSDDDNISNYIDDSSKKTKLIKVDGLDVYNKDTVEVILFSLVNKLTNEYTLELENSLYRTNPILFFHPIIFRLISDSQIHINELDDPSETIAEIYSYFHELDLKNTNVRSDISVSQPINFKKKKKYIYGRCQELLKEKYNEFLINTIKFWLKNSWNVNYNVKVEKEDIELQKSWQTMSYNLLEELLDELDFSEFTKCNENGERKYDVSDEKDFINIRNTIKIFKNSCKKSIVKNKEEDLSYKIIWPHEKYPIPSYIQNVLSQNNNKKLYFQNSNFNFVNYSVELIKDYEILESKINYYRDIFELIDKTKVYFPLSIQDLIQKISDRIQTNQPVFQKKENEDFKQLANIFLRISILFGEAVVGKDKVSFNEDDLASLGGLVGVYRDKIINKDNSELFYLKYEELPHADCDDEIIFVKEHGKILDKKATFFKALEDQDASVFDKNNKISNFNAKENDKKEYLNRILRADNLDLISQLSTISRNLAVNEQKLKILKYKDAYKLLGYLADTRNMWEHKYNALWDNDFFIRFFIYSFESIWLMQKYILEELGQKDLPNTKYIELNKEKIVSVIRFKTLEEYNRYLELLYEEKKEDKVKK